MVERTTLTKTKAGPKNVQEQEQFKTTIISLFEHVSVGPRGSWFHPTQGPATDYAAGG